jgi:broad specificity phosphatase PhoE
MSVLTLVRHGQARPFENDSDRLTDLGARQARALGAHWARRRTMCDQAWSGTLERQRKTAEIVATCYHEAGLEFPALQQSEAFNEYSVPIPEDALREVQLAPADRRNRIFQFVIETAMAQWMKTPEFTTFHRCVTEGMKSLIRNAPQSRIMVFTSGGPIGVCVQTVLHAPVQQAIEINWRVRNCSLTEFIFSGSRISLDCFNATPHLGSDELQSFR